MSPITSHDIGMAAIHSMLVSLILIFMACGELVEDTHATPLKKVSLVAYIVLQCTEIVVTLMFGIPGASGLLFIDLVALVDYLLVIPIAIVTALLAIFNDRIDSYSVVMITYPCIQVVYSYGYCIMCVAKIMNGLVA